MRSGSIFGGTGSLFRWRSSRRPGHGFDALSIPDTPGRASGSVALQPSGDLLELLDGFHAPRAPSMVPSECGTPRSSVYGA